MNADAAGAFVALLSWPEVARRIDHGAVAVLPVGAACKEHGPHLPMQADWMQAQWLAASLVARANVLVWPTVGYGYYPAFTDYPGSISLCAGTFEAMVGDILEGIQGGGVTSVMILNTGISTIGPLRALSEQRSNGLQVTLANAYDGPHYRDAARALEQQACGSHADELETSIMLAIDRQSVRQHRLAAWTPPTMAAAGPFSRDPRSPRYSPGGVWGDPTLASADKGRQLLAAMVADLVALIESLGR